MPSHNNHTTAPATECLISLPAEIENLTTFLEFVRECAGRVGLAPERAADLEIAVEEAVANICTHGYPQGAGDVAIRCFMEAHGTRVCVEIADSGEPFDVSAAVDPDLTSALEERPVGGLGIHLMRQLADEIRYERSEGRNILRILIEAGPHDEG